MFSSLYVCALHFIASSLLPSFFIPSFSLHVHFLKFMHLALHNVLSIFDVCLYLQILALSKGNGEKLVAITRTSFFTLVFIKLPNALSRLGQPRRCLRQFQFPQWNSELFVTGTGKCKPIFSQTRDSGDASSEKSERRGEGILT